MTQHTPRPWKLERDRAKSLSLYSGAIFIGEVYHEADEPSPQEQANAALIAAAPELLEAAKVALTKLEGMAERFGDKWPLDLSRQKAETLLNHAITKAEGRG